MSNDIEEICDMLMYGPYKFAFEISKGVYFLREDLGYVDSPIEILRDMMNDLYFELMRDWEE
jgi:hypothetical protein